jgi:hypothetical protein
MCESALQDCLGVAHAARNDDDEDAGGKSAHAEAVADCVDTLHACVKGDADANMCAQNVRECVLGSIPAPGDVVPGAGKANGRAGHADDEDAGVHENKSNRSDQAAHDAGRPSDVPAQPHAAGAPAHGNGNADAQAGSAAMACLDAFTACVDAGSNPRDCAKNLRSCSRGKE